MNTFLFSATKFFQKKTFLALTAVLSIASGFFVANAVFAVAPDVAVSPIMVKGGSVGTTYTFAFTNNLSAPIYDITITAPTGFTITDNLVCPAGWANYSSTVSAVRCLGDNDPATNLFIPSGQNATVSFTATSPLTNSVIPWTVDAKDNTFTHRIYVPVTTVDATAPVTAVSETDTAWHKGSVLITLTPSDVGGSEVASTHYQINDGAWNTYADPFEVSTQGINSVSYYSIDGVENTEATQTVESIKIDNLAPETTLSIGEKKSGTDPVYIKSDTEISLSATDDGSEGIVTSYTIDDSAPVTYSAPFALATAGIHHISYGSVDAVGNVEEIRTVSVFVDDLAPTVSPLTISPISGSFISGLSDISAVATDNDGSGVAKCEYTLDGANWTLIADGKCAVTGVDTTSATSINIRATDNLGNEQEGTAVPVTPDFTEPTTSDSGTNADWHNTNVTVTLTTEADASGIASTHYRINDGAWNLYTGAFEVSDEGENTISYYSVDNVGNAETAHQTAFTVKIDKTAPTITDNSVSGWKNTATTVTLTPADSLSPLAGVKYCEGESCDVSEGTILVSPYAIPFIADGVKTIRYQTADVAGNLSAIGTFTVQTDLTDPSAASVTSVKPMHTVDTIHYVRGTVTLDASALDEVSGIAKVVFYHSSAVRGTIGEDMTAPYSLSWDTHSVSDGSHDVYVVAYDQAGNMLESAHFPITVDNETPTLASSVITGGFAMGENKTAFSPKGLMNTISINIAFSEEVKGAIKIKDQSGVVVRDIYSSDKVTNPNPYDWNGKNDSSVFLSDGLYTVEITATDHAGNTFTDTSKTILLDNTAPSVDVGADIITTADKAVVASANDTESGIVSYSWTGEVLTFSSASAKDTTISATADGVYHATLTVTDNVGNTASDHLTFTKDTAKPTVALSSPIADSVYKTNENILAFTASDTRTEVACEYQVNGGIAVSIPCTGIASLSGLVDGRNTVTVTATDAAGNTFTSEGQSFVHDNNNTLTVGATGADFTTIIEAVKKSTVGDTIAITPGNYNLVKDDVTMISGQAGWYLPITKSLTLIGVDANGQEITDPANVMANIYSTQETANGNWSTQNLITVFADNVSIRGLGIMNKIQPNKGIEVLGNNFRAENNTFAPVSVSLFANAGDYVDSHGVHNDITKYGSGVYFNNNGATTARTGTVVNNIFKNSGVTFDSFGSNWTINVANNTFDGNRIRTEAGVNYYYSSVGATTWANQPNFTGSSLKINSNKFVNMADNQPVLKIKDGMTGHFDGTKNWWGTTDGSVIAGRILGNVSFRPWYLTDALTDLDETAPTVTLSSTVTSPTNVSSIPVTIAWSEEVNGFEESDISVTNGEIELTDSGFIVTPDENGPVTVSIGAEKADDLSGNYNTASNVLSFVFDDVDPTATVSYNPESLTNGDVTATMIAGNEDVTITSEGGDSHLFTENGTFLFTFHDAAGNEGSVEANVSYIDKTAPAEVTLENTPASLTNSTVTDIKVGGADVVAYQYKLDDGSYGTEELVATHIELSDLSDGVHTISVIGRDEAGNWQETAATHTWTIETVHPTVVSKTPSVNAVGIDSNANVLVTFSEAVTIAPENIIITKGDVSIPATVAFDANTKIATIQAPFEGNSTYVVTLLSTITDAAGNTLTETSWSFTTAVNYSIPLTKGWNLISLPVVPGNTAVASVLGTAKDNIETVWSYDADNEKWSVYHANSNETSDLSSMTAGYGYWVNYTGTNASALVGSGNLVQEGNSVPPSRKLKEGWNLIGYYQRPNTTSVSAENALYNNLNNVWTLLFGYDNTNKHITTLNGNSLLNPGEAFWVWLDGNRSYTMGNAEMAD